MSFVLAPVIALFHYALQPLPVFAWLGAPVSALDVAGALRLAVALRQVRELYHDQHVTKANHKNRSGGKTSGKAQRVAADETLEPRSRARDFIATLVIVHGGEAIVAPWLGLRPAFFVSSTSSMTFLGAHALVDLLPTLPSPSLHTEVPLTIVHAFFRSILLCNVVPRVVAGHASPAVAASSYTLLLSAWILANGGPFVSNLFSLLRPTQIEVATPPELLSYGWTATDFWSPMLVTGLYATLTHAQPFFTSIHSLLFAFFWPFGLVRLSDATTKSGGSAGRHQGVVAPVDHETARAVCAIVLCALNVNRAMRAYGPGYAAIITQIANAASAAKPGAVKPLPEPSLDDEKSEHSPEEDIVDTKRKGRAESATSRDLPRETRSSRHLRRRNPA